ncbi:MAG TPA: peptidyl-prolyl cis-trans isomerase [Bryobacteraceae bacterium]|jgi:peptidyl-prolyl cis-trans isomerase C|nr:peptidyl-prolyl cis-trans isomerase [Bryobacteraceae bacterium]
MKVPVFLLMCAAVAFAQPATAPAEDRSPDHVVAEVNGKAITVADLRRILSNAPDNIHQVLNENPADFLERYTMLSQLTAEAIRDTLDKQSPYKERLEWQRTTVLMMALLEDKSKNTPVPKEEIEAAYKADLMRYRVAEVLPIVIPFDKAAGVRKTEAAARKLAQEVWQELRKGAPFMATMEKYSDPSASALYKKEYPTILPNSKIPEPVKKAVFATLPGQITDPLPFGNAIYIFQVVSLNAAPLGEVADLIASEIREKRVDAEMKQLNQEAKVEINHPVYFQLQDPTAPPGREIPADLRSETVVATVNGRGYTSVEMTNVLNGAPPTVRQSASKRPREFLVQLAMMNELAEQARRLKLNEGPPASDRIRWTDMQTLMQAKIDETMKGISNSAQEQEAYYKDNQKRYQKARVKLIYIPYSLAPAPPTAANRPRTEKEAKARADEVLAKLKTGAEFTLLVQEYSEDTSSKGNNGEFMPILATDTRIPEDIKKAIFATAPGAVTPALQQANGYYIFRVEESGVIPYDQIRNQIYEEMRQAKFQKWFEDLRNGIKVKIVDGTAIRAELVRPL